MAGNGTTVGIWVGESDDVVDKFDEALGSDPQYSRSEKIKDAMRLYVAVEDAIENADYAFDAEQAKRHWVRQAVMDQVRFESSRQG